MKSRLLSLGLAAALLIPGLAMAQEVTDIPTDSPVYPAATYLMSKGIVQMSNTFKPNDKLTRSQVAKILVAPLVDAAELAKITTSSFGDVPAGSWYLPYAEAARALGIVDSAPAFNPAAPVTKAAFMKMLLGSKKIDYKALFSDLSMPLGTDVPNTTDWFYPVMRYGVASSMTAVGADGLLSPGRELTRGDMALLYYRLDMYLAGRRTQALLAQAETDIANVLQMLDQKQIDQAGFAAGRAVVASRGALAARPSEALVKAAVKVSEGFQALVKAFRSGSEGKYDEAIQYAKDAYALADKAKSFSPNLSDVANQMQTVAKNMADQARKAKTGQ